MTVYRAVISVRLLRRASSLWVGDAASLSSTVCTAAQRRIGRSVGVDAAAAAGKKSTPLTGDCRDEAKLKGPVLAVQMNQRCGAPENGARGKGWTVSCLGSEPRRHSNRLVRRVARRQTVLLPRGSTV
jgi:hypothetical protein